MPPRLRGLYAITPDERDTARLLEKVRAAIAGGASYVAFGSFLPSTVKPGAVTAPLHLLREAKASLAITVVAIGGITIENAPRLLAAGADGIAVISALFSAADVGGTAQRFCRIVRATDET